MHRSPVAPWLALALTLGLVAGLEQPGAATTTADRPGLVTVDDGLYVVALRGTPLAAFDGDASFAATRPRPGHRFRPDSAAARAYEQALGSQQQTVLDALGDPEVLYTYTTALNGFAARLTTAQVKLLQTMPEVLSVQASRTDHLDQTGSLSGSAVTQLAPTLAPTSARDGSGVVIGVIDTGVWPENPSFTGVPLDQRTRRQLYPGFTGSCGTGERWSSSLCTTKIVAAQYFVEGFGADALSSAEYLSPRDASGHGSHAAAIAAGNADVEVTIDGQSFGQVSGVAPSAALAVYKACWSAPDPADDGCATADTVAAIDRSVRDGVDVLNYSASPGSAPVDDVVELAFLGAASAGVVVTTTAGDDGPSAGTVAHTSPWLTTVAASKQSPFEGGIRLGDGREFVGAMVSDSTVPSAPLVLARDAAGHGAASADAALCLPGTLDASVADGAIVLCERGVVARVTKSATAEQAGAVGLVLANERGGDTYADVHAVPTLQVDAATGRALATYISRARRPTASLEPEAGARPTAPRLAEFSSRGPVIALDGDHLKPDLTAPGVDVVSAVAPPANFGRLWDLYSGTSMAAPHVAGAAALVLDQHPSWSPAAVKSALMTTATPLAGRSGPLQHGAGEVAAAAAADPGLVYDASPADWHQFLRARGVEPFSAVLPGASVATSSNLNEAAVAVGRLIGRARVVRSVTNVGTSAETYTASVTGLRGIAVRVQPQTITLAPGRTATFRITLTAQRAARYGEFASGSLTWRGSAGHVVTSPVVVRPELLAAPAEVHATGSSGSVEAHGLAGVTGTIRANLVGPVAAVPSSVELTRGPFDSADPDSAGAAVRTFTAGESTAALRFELSGATSDTDLYVYRGGRLVATSNGTGPDEQLTLLRPAAGDYDVYAVAAGNQSDEQVTATLTGWVLPAGHAGTMSVEHRVRATGLQRVDVGVTWSALSDAQRWFALVRYPGSDQQTALVLN